MKRIAPLFILTFAAAGAMAAPFSGGDAKNGKKLFDKNDCNSCHIGKAGGDGSAIFTRPGRIVQNPQELLDRMHACSGAVGKTLTPQDDQDLGAYLNQRYYKFK